MLVLLMAAAKILVVKAGISIGQAREPLLKGRLSAVDLFVQTSLNQMLWKQQTLFTLLQNKLP